MQYENNEQNRSDNQLIPVIDNRTITRFIFGSLTALRLVK